MNKKNKINKNRINNKFISGRINVSSHPPSFDMQPWFNLTLRLLDPPTNITVNVIRTALATQLQFSQAIDFDMRIFECRFWGAIPDGSGALQPLTVRIWDPTCAQVVNSRTTSFPVANPINTCAVIQDFPDRVNRARIGYRFTPGQSQVVTSCDAAGGAGRLFATTGMGTNSVAYLNILWRPKSNFAPTIVDEPPQYEPSAPTASCFKMF
jgi:hypothetical protein